MQIKVTKINYQIILINEYWTLGNLLSRYIFLEDPNITFCAAALIHPEKNTIVIKLQHIKSIIH